MFRNLKSIIITGLLFALVNSSCSKKTPLPAAEENNKKLKVELNSTYLSGNNIDSAVAVWNVNGIVNRVFLTNNNDTLFADLKQFQTGTGEISIEIFSSKKFGGFYPSRWVLQKQVTIALQDLKFEGPTEFTDTQWKPRVELKDNIGHFAVVALRPDDPYFFIKNLPGDLKKIIVARDYWKQGGRVFRIGGGEWQCSANCTNANNNIENFQFFSFLSTQIGPGTWNHVEITILYVQDEWGGGSVLNFTHTL